MVSHYLHLNKIANKDQIETPKGEMVAVRGMMPYIRSPFIRIRDELQTWAEARRRLRRAGKKLDQETLDDSDEFDVAIVDGIDIIANDNRSRGELYLEDVIDIAQIDKRCSKGSLDMISEAEEQMLIREKQKERLKSRQLKRPRKRTRRWFVGAVKEKKNEEECKQDLEDALNESQGREDEEGRNGLEEVRRLCWKGVCCRNRARVWKILLRYDALNREESRKILKVKRNIYDELVEKSMREIEEELENGFRSASEKDGSIGSDAEGKCDRERAGGNNEDVGGAGGEKISKRRSSGCMLVRQIELDLPRTHPDLPFFQIDQIRAILRRCLVVFGLTKKEVSYVQGMNEIVALFCLIYFTEYVPKNGDGSIENVVNLRAILSEVGAVELRQLEADVFWSFVSIADKVYDNYIIDQPGIYKAMGSIQKLLHLKDSALEKHLKRIEIELIHFIFRYINCLWIREFRFPIVVRVWDRFLMEFEHFMEFQIFFCVALLLVHRDKLLKMEFQEAILFLQHLAEDEEMSLEKVERILLKASELWKEFEGKGVV